jgi:hypothetical protein
MGSYKQGDNRVSMKLKGLIFIKHLVRGWGTDVVGKFIFTGTYSSATGEVDLLKKYIGQHTVAYKGKLNETLDKITGIWSILENESIRDEFKFSKHYNIKWARPFDKIKLPEGEV